jgi:hypothetical protein
MDGAGLNVTVMSYRGVLNWGLMACAETVPGVASIAQSIPVALDELRAAAGLGPSTPVGIAPGHPASQSRTGHSGNPSRPSRPSRPGSAGRPSGPPSSKRPSLGIGALGPDTSAGTNAAAGVPAGGESSSR